jgi:serine/threonine-protein kinase
MNSTASEEAFRAVKSLFDSVADLPPHARRVALTAQTDDVALVDRVMSILDATDDNSTGQALVDQLAAPIGALAKEWAVGDARTGAQPELTAGDTVGVWALTREIGRGGMGSVFMVERRDGHFQQRAALKLLKGFASHRAIEYLARERQILASLAHPNIARLFDGGATPRGRPYLVLEYVEGVPIDAYCRDKSLTRSRVLSLFITVCRAVAFAHRALVVHCDLKPSNVLVKADGHPVLLDFGVSRLLDDAAEAARDNEAITMLDAGGALTLTQAAFTPRYASPEQLARGRSGRIGTASDIYSLGLVLAELLGQRLAPRADNDDGVMALTLSARETLGLNAPDLVAILDYATALDPASRYVSADALADDITRFMQHEPVRARAPTPLYVAQKFVRRHWPALTVGAAFVATVVGFSWHTVRERDAARLAEQSARAMKDYMVSVFQGADPEITGQRDIPVSQLLDAGRERLGIRLKDQPGMRAEMSGILGSVYQNIGKRDEAMKLFDEAITLERKAARSDILATLLYKKAYTLYDKEDFPAAEPIARESLVLRAKHQPNTAEHAEALSLLGVVLAYQSNQSKAEEAGSLLARALMVATTARGPQSVNVARVHLDTSRFHASVGANAPSQTHARAARDILAENVGKDHYLYLDALEFEGFALGAASKFDDALPLLREVAHKRATRYGEVSNPTGYALYTLGNVLWRAGDYLEAAVVLTRCIAIQEKLDGRATLSTSIPMNLLGTVKTLMGSLIEGEEHLREVLAIRARLLPAGDMQINEAQYELGRNLRAQSERGQLAALVEADRLLTSAKAGAARASASWNALRIDLELVAVRRLQGRYADARAIATGLHRNEAVSKNPWRTAQVRIEEMAIADAEGRTAEAARLQDDIEAIVIKLESAQHVSLWMLKLTRAERLARHPATREASVSLAREVRAGLKRAIDPKGSVAARLNKLGA